MLREKRDDARSLGDSMKQGSAVRVPQNHAGPGRRATTYWLVVGLLLLLFSGAVALGQRKESKEKKKELLAGLPEEQVINADLSEMLAAWQIGNVELLHKHYADDVTVVSGAWEPPLMGWTNYVKAYQGQQQRMQGGNLDRVNTYVNVKGNIAWAAYQWQFSALVDGKPTSARGHTSLILEKRNGRWLIVHNHTSIVPEVREVTPAPSPKPAASRSVPRGVVADSRLAGAG